MSIINDPIGKPGLLFLGSGYLLHIMEHFNRSDLFAWGGFLCTLVGGGYYSLKIYNDFIKKPKAK